MDKWCTDQLGPTETTQDSWIMYKIFSKAFHRSEEQQYVNLKSLFQTIASFTMADSLVP